MSIPRNPYSVIKPVPFHAARAIFTAISNEEALAKSTRERACAARHEADCGDADAAAFEARAAAFRDDLGRLTGDRNWTYTPEGS